MNMAEYGQYDTLANLTANVGLANPNNDPNRNYQIAVNIAGNTFTATASPTGSHVDNVGGSALVFAIRSDGQVGRMNGASFVSDPELWKSLRP